MTKPAPLRPALAPEGYDDSRMCEVLDSMGHDGGMIIAALNGDIWCGDKHVEAWNDAVARILEKKEDEEEE